MALCGGLTGHTVARINMWCSAKVQRLGAVRTGGAESCSPLAETGPHVVLALVHKAPCPLTQTCNPIPSADKMLKIATPPFKRTLHLLPL
eukprot:4008040-Amphidinium_carterae.1